jgi:hypothetical protein
MGRVSIDSKEKKTKLQLPSLSGYIALRVGIHPDDDANVLLTTGWAGV